MCGDGAITIVSILILVIGTYSVSENVREKGIMDMRKQKQTKGIMKNKKRASCMQENKIEHHENVKNKKGATASVARPHHRTRRTTGRDRATPRSQIPPDLMNPLGSPGTL